MSEQYYKSVAATPFRITTLPKRGKHAVELDMTSELAKLKQDMILITSLAGWGLHTPGMLDEIESHETGRSQKATILARKLDNSVPDSILKNWPSGASRAVELINTRIVKEGRSWLARSHVKTGTSKKYVSQGWKRTASNAAPAELAPKIDLPDANHQYSQITEYHDDILIMKLVISGKWRLLYFTIPEGRVSGYSKIAKPTISLNEKGDPVFHFSFAYDYQHGEISSKYITAIDVGVTNYATVGVYDRESRTLVHATTLSQRVHSLANSVRATTRQVKYLTMKREQFDPLDTEYEQISEEIRHQRESNSRKKVELAILAARETAEIAHTWDNSLLIIEDLSWIRNTMENGRWNRGEFVRWLKHYATQNGSRVLRASAYKTSQVCHSCGATVTFHGWHVVECKSCGLVADRDVNATGNIALSGESSVVKSIATRVKSKNYTGEKTQLKSGKTTPTLKYPGRDRSKSGPTRKRCTKVRVANQLPVFEEVKKLRPGTRNDDGMVVPDEVMASALDLGTLEKRRDYSVTIE